VSFTDGLSGKSIAISSPPQASAGQDANR